MRYCVPLLDGLDDACRLLCSGPPDKDPTPLPWVPYAILRRSLWLFGQKVTPPRPRSLYIQSIRLRACRDRDENSPPRPRSQYSIYFSTSPIRPTFPLEPCGRCQQIQQPFTTATAFLPTTTTTDLLSLKHRRRPQDFQIFSNPTQVLTSTRKSGHKQAHHRLLDQPSAPQDPLHSTVFPPREFRELFILQPPNFYRQPT